jgi:hypothetical protein
MTERSVDAHLESLRRIGSIAKKAGAIMINSHSGVDSWNLKQVCVIVCE